MRNVFVFIVLGVIVALPGQVRGDLTGSVSFTLSLSSGSDTLGLNGSTVVLNTLFVNGTTYADVFGLPGAPASTHSIMISGASNPASNGTFADPDGLLYTPSAGEGLFVDNVANYFFLRTPTIDSGLSFKFGLSLNPPAAVPNFGDYMNASDFATSPTAFGVFEAVINDTAAASATYVIGGGFTASFVGSTNPIPEPGSVLVAGSLVVLGSLFRRQRRPLNFH